MSYPSSAPRVGCLSRIPSLRTNCGITSRGKAASTLIPLGFFFASCSTASSRITRLRQLRTSPHPYNATISDDIGGGGSGSSVVFQPDFARAPYPNLWNASQTATTVSGSISRITDNDGRPGI